MPTLVSSALTLRMWLLSSAIFVAGPKGNNIVVVADTRKNYGWEAWCASLYNGSHVMFAIAVVILVSILGVLVGAVVDRIMARIGIDTKIAT
jgi:hypothetical protein